MRKINSRHESQVLMYDDQQFQLGRFPYTVYFVEAKCFQTAASNCKPNRSRTHPESIVIRNQLIATLGGQHLSRDNDHASAEKT